MKMLDDLLGRVFGGSKAAQAKEDAAAMAKLDAARAAKAARDAAAAVAAAQATADAAAEQAVEAEEEAVELEAVAVIAKETAPPSISPEQAVDRLEAQQTAHPEDLDWKRSIVDLMKLTGMDSSYKARKALAVELGYSAEDLAKGSAEMNMWLHKRVVTEIAQNGGNVPSELMA